MLDVALKVCVYYCHLPSERVSERVVPWLNSAIDTPLLKDLKRRYGFSGASTLAEIDREKYDMMLDEYYDFHGWDRDGNPTPETLKKIGLDNVDEWKYV